MGLPNVARMARDLAATARILSDVLEAIGAYGNPVALERLATDVGADPDDVYRALIALEHGGLVETTHFRITGAGQDARREANAAP